MNPERFTEYVESIRGGCKNRLEEGEIMESYYLDAYNKLTGIFMGINAQRKDSDEDQNE